MSTPYLLGSITHSTRPVSPEEPASSDSPEGLVIRSVRRLGDSEWTRFQDYVRVLADFEQVDRLYQLFDRNVFVFFAFLEEVLNADANKAIAHENLFEILIEVDRHLLNILTGMRTFLDHSGTRLSRVYGNASKELASFKQACSAEYDNYFSYRFLYNLRNYAQHCGLPVGSIDIVSRSMRLRKAPPHYRVFPDSLSAHRVIVLFDRDLLLRSFDKWKSVEGELRQMPQHIEITRHVEGLKRSMIRLHARLFSLTSREPRKAARYLASLWKEARAKYPDLEPVIITQPRRLNKRRPTLTFHHFPVRAMRLLISRADEIIGRHEEPRT